jgi:hypothetical protein
MGKELMMLKAHLTEEKKVELATDWFAEDWAITKAVGILHDYDSRLRKTTPPAAQPAPESGSWYAAKEIDEMVRDLDVALNGDGAAPQAKLCDLMPQLIQRLTARPAVPDALNPKDENPAYAAGWNDCRAAMMEMMK